MKQLSLCFSLFLLVFFSIGQGDFRFSNFTISNGLSQSYVTCILQDNTAALWIGTQDGLNRFDGKNFEIYSSDETPGIAYYFLNQIRKNSPPFKLRTRFYYKSKVLQEIEMIIFGLEYLVMELFNLIAKQKPFLNLYQIFQQRKYILSLMLIITNC